MCELKKFKDRGTGRDFVYFKDEDTYFVFENNKLFYKGQATNIETKIEELRGELSYIAFPDSQERMYAPRSIEYSGFYEISNTDKINGIYYKTDLFIDDARVWTKAQDYSPNLEKALTYKSTAMTDIEKEVYINLIEHHIKQNEEISESSMEIYDILCNEIHRNGLKR